ncbi:MAG: ACT domain-containing protein [Terricaulis sp.]|nr:ACT domain-containing protein [Terricaulis sp.]
MPNTIESRTLAILVDNEPGVLARVVGMFSARGYNIESLTVAETDVGATHPASRWSRAAIRKPSSKSRRSSTASFQSAAWRT